VYDDVALTNDEITVSGDGFISGEGATYDVTGSGILVGQYPNTFTYTLNKNTSAEDYIITQVFGTLTVGDGTESWADDPVDPPLVTTISESAPYGQLPPNEYKYGDEIIFNVTATNIYADTRDISLSMTDGVTLAQAYF